MHTVAYVSESFYPCGVKVVIDDCILAAQESNWNTRLIGPQNPFENQPEGLWLPSKLVSKERAYRRALFFSPRTNRLLESELRDSNIIHLHSLSPLTLRVILLRDKLKARNPKLKIILHLHTQYDQYLRTWYGLLGKVMVGTIDTLIKYCLSKVDLVIFPTNFYRTIFEGKFSRQLSGKNTLTWSAPIRVQSGLKIFKETVCEMGDRRLSSDSVLFTYVGRVCPEKRIPELLQTFCHLVDANRQHKLGLVIMGPGDIRPYRQIADLLPNDNGSLISFLGHQKRDVVLSINRVSDFGISLSDTEVQGLAILEQMACSLPVLVLQNTCWEHTIKRSNGGVFLDQEGSFDQITNLIQNNCQRCLAGRNARTAIETEFSEKEQFRQLIDIYQSLQSQD